VLDWIGLGSWGKMGSWRCDALRKRWSALARDEVDIWVLKWGAVVDVPSGTLSSPSLPMDSC
jgi:hypothetical protein